MFKAGSIHLELELLPNVVRGSGSCTPSTLPMVYPSIFLSPENLKKNKKHFTLFKGQDLALALPASSGRSSSPTWPTAFLHIALQTEGMSGHKPQAMMTQVVWHFQKKWQRNKKSPSHLPTNLPKWPIRNIKWRRDSTSPETRGGQPHTTDSEGPPGHTRDYSRPMWNMGPSIQFCILGNAVLQKVMRKVGQLHSSPLPEQAKGEMWTTPACAHF